jgi:cobalamin synthase
MKWFRGRYAIYLPAFGAVLGAFGGWVFVHARVLPNAGLAVLFAAFWEAFVPREDRAYGFRRAMFSTLNIVTRSLLLVNLATPRVGEVLVVAQIIPRASMIALAWVSRPAPWGVGYEFSSTLVSWEAAIAILEGVAAAMWLGIRPGVMILAGTYVILRLVQWLSYRYQGGVNADGLGMTQLLTEFFVLLLFDCSACRW